MYHVEVGSCLTLNQGGYGNERGKKYSVEGVC